MTLDDIEIKIKKYDKKKNVVIVNLVVLGEIEMRGFVVRYVCTKDSPRAPVWVVSPPSVVGRNKKYFWIVKFLDSALWQRLKEAIADVAREHANSLSSQYS